MRMARVRQMATGRSRQPRPRCFRINHLALALALLFTGADDHAARRSQSFVRLGRVGLLHGIGERVQRALESRRDTSNRALDHSPGRDLPSQR